MQLTLKFIYLNYKFPLHYLVIPLKSPHWYKISFFIAMCMRISPKSSNHCCSSSVLSISLFQMEIDFLISLLGDAMLTTRWWKLALENIKGGKVVFKGFLVPFFLYRRLFFSSSFLCRHQLFRGIFIFSFVSLLPISVLLECFQKVVVVLKRSYQLQSLLWDF